MVWKPSWLQSDDKEDKENKNDLPPEIEKRFKVVDEVKADVTKINERLASLDSITAFIDEQKKDKEEAKKAADIAAAKKNEKKDERTAEDIAAELLTDPRKVIAEETNPLANAILQVRADQTRRQVFEDRSDEFEYYTGDIKKEVDKLISQQNLQFQNNASSLENAYHTVVGKKMKEINEGKIKSRFAAPSGTSLSKGQEKKEDLDFELTPDMLKAARLTGMDPKDYKELVKKAAIAGEFEVV